MLVELKKDGGVWVGVGILRKPDGSCRMSSGFGLHFWIFIGGRFCQPLKAAFEQDGNL